VEQVSNILNINSLLRLGARGNQISMLPLYTSNQLSIDDTSIFVQIRGPLKIKDQAGRTSHKDVRPNKQHVKSPIVTPR
jgi:hypothetical protein